MHILIHIEFLVVIGMNSHKECCPTLNGLDNGVYDTCLQVVASGEHKVEANVMAQVLDMIFGVVNVAEAARVVGGDGALYLGCGQTCGLCMGMLVCGYSKACHGGGMNYA